MAEAGALAIAEAGALAIAEGAAEDAGAAAALDAAELDELLGVLLLSLPQALRVSAPAASRANRALVRVICTPILQVKVTSRTKLPHKEQHTTDRDALRTLGRQSGQSGGLR